MSLRVAFLGAFLGCGLIVPAATAPAHAQHVVTDYEAGKLTLDALTAAPRPVYRPVYQRIMAVRRTHRPGYVSHMMHGSAKTAFHRRVASHTRHH